MSATFQERVRYQIVSERYPVDRTPLPFASAIPPILLVDASPECQSKYTDILKMLGCQQIDVVAHGQKALEMMLAGNGYDLVFLEFGLANPQMNGGDVVREFLAAKKNPNTRIILLTAIPPKLLPESLLDSIAWYGYKPHISPDGFRRLLSELYDKPAL